MTFCRIAPRLLLTLCAFAALPSAHAAVFCVSTGLALDNALNTAANNGQNDEIRIATGVLTGSSRPNQEARWQYTPGSSDENTSLIVSGGWTPANTCTSQGEVPSATQLDAEHKGAALLFLPTISPFAGAITLRNLLITRGLTRNNPAAGIRYRATGTLGANFEMSRVMVVASRAEMSGNSIVDVWQGGSGQVRIINNLIASNSVHPEEPPVTVTVGCTASAVCYLNNNTIFDNLVSNNQGHYGLLLHGTVSAANNVVAANTAVQFNPSQGRQAGSLSGAGAMSLRNNHFETKLFPSPYLEENTTTGDPVWTVTGSYPQPNANSPLRNSGRANPVGGSVAKDIRGAARVQEGSIDRGAVESPPPANEPPVLAQPSPVTIPETLPIGGSVAQFSYTDDGLPGPIVWTLVNVASTPSNPAGNGPFSLNQNGLLSKTQPIDPISTSTFLVTVRISDGQFSDEKQLIVHVNRAPVLEDASLAIPNTTPPGTALLTFTPQDDGLPQNGSTSFHIQSVQAQPAASNPFTLDVFGGVLRLAHPLPTVATTYTVVVRVSDGQLSSTATITIESSPPPAGEGIFGDGFE